MTVPEHDCILHGVWLTVADGERADGAVRLHGGDRERGGDVLLQGEGTERRGDVAGVEHGR